MSFSLTTLVFLLFIDNAKERGTEKKQLPTFVSKNTMHRLCILPSFRDLRVSSDEYALSTCLHAPHHGENVKKLGAKNTLGYVPQYAPLT